MAKDVTIPYGFSVNRTRIEGTEISLRRHLPLRLRSGPNSYTLPPPSDACGDFLNIR